jgi:hypothetical protein
MGFSQKARQKRALENRLGPTDLAAERRPFGEAMLACQWGGWQGSGNNNM